MLEKVLFIVVGAVLLSSCAHEPNPLAPQALPKSLASTKQQDPELNEAIAKSRNSLDSFIKRLDHPQRAEVFQVQASFPALDGTPEYLWVGDVTFRDGSFTGTPTSKPHLHSKVAYGDSVTLKKADVTDWMILKSGATEGGFTVDVLLRREGQPQ